MRVLGIDFGTSNTAAMLRMPDGRTRPLLFDGAPLMPTAVYLTPDGQMLVGRDAERHSRMDPSRFEPNPKRRVDDGVVLLGEAELPVPQVFAAVLRQVGAEAHRQLGAAPEQVRLTHPARWGEQRRRVLSEAARLAGLPAPQLIVEPVAAASYFTAVLRSAVPVGRCLAIYDLGGGTFDATVVRRTPGGFAVLAEEGLPDVGGLDFDHAVVEYLGRTYARSHPDQWASLVNPIDATQRRNRRMLYDDVRAAKEMLSRTPSADIALPGMEVEAHLTREEFETLVRPYLERTVACLNRCVAATGIPARDLVGIFLVGGSSRIPLAAHLIHTELQVPPTTLEQPETVVVEGSLCIGAPTPPPGAAHPGHSGVPRAFTPQPVTRQPVSRQPVTRAPASPVPAQPAYPAGYPPPQPARTWPATQPAAPQSPALPRTAPVPAGGQTSAPPVSPARPATSGPATAGTGPTRPAPQPPRMVPPAGPLPPPVRPVPAVAPQAVRRAPVAPAPRPWYHEPVKVGTAVAVVLLIALIAVLVIVAAS